MELDDLIEELHSAIDRISLLADVMQDMIEPAPEPAEEQQELDLPLDIRGHR